MPPTSSHAFLDLAGAPGGVPLAAWRAWLAVVLLFGLFHGIGVVVSRVARFHPIESDRADARTALGLAVAPAIILLAGCLPRGFGWIAPLVWIGGAAGLAHCAFGATRELVRAIFRRTGSDAPPILPFESLAPAPRALFLAGRLLLMARLLAMLGPAVSPPSQYDVLEYHLAVVPHWFAEGRIAPIPGVFYTAQPIATEALFGAAAAAEGVPRGVSSGLVVAGLFVLTAGLVERAALRAGAPLALAPWCALLFLGHPTIFTLGLDRLTDMTGAALAGGGLLIATATGAPTSRRALLLGVLAGGAVASKWTNAGTVVPLLFLAAMAARSDGGAGRTRTVGEFALGGGLALGPWIGWLAIVHGNPLAPFAAGMFPTDAWPPERLGFLLHTHGAVGPLSGEYWRNILSRGVGMGLLDGTGAPPLPAILVVGVALAALLRRTSRDPQGAAYGGAAEEARSDAVRRIPTLALVATCIAFLTWGRLRLAQDRFLAPTLLAQAVALGALAGGLSRGTGSASRALGLALGAAIVAFALRPLPDHFRFLLGSPPGASVRDDPRPPYWAFATGRVTDRDYLRRTLGATADFFEAMNRADAGTDAGEGRRTIAIGEARGYYLRRPPALASVFDRHPIVEFARAAESAEALERGLRAAGFARLAVNEHEVARLLDFHPPEALERDPEFQRTRGPGRERAAARALRYAGWIEFGPEADAAEARDRLREFLERMRRRANVPEAAAPTFWVATLEAER